jgi:hypothetical protein
MHKHQPRISYPKGRNKNHKRNGHINPITSMKNNPAQEQGKDHMKILNTNLHPLLKYNFNNSI